MAKIKFDRNINVILKDNEEIEVPKDEVWKGTRSGTDAINGTSVNAVRGFNKLIDSIMLGGGAKITGKGAISGVAFKVI